jgi:methyltransferase (TIGR00027 family)
MSAPIIEDVADTAFWIAHHRALESARPDALFRDPLAARLAGERGRRISDTMRTSGIVAWTVTLRTVIIDDLIRESLAAGVETVLNLGAGLDTRPYRLTLPTSLRWIEADYPRLIEYKESLLGGEKAHPRLERVKIDLTRRAERRAFLEEINRGSTRVLVLTEGVVPYLTNHEVASLAQDLRAMERFRYWVVDYFSPQILEYRRKKGMEQQMGNAPFRFHPADWFEFFGQQGWKASEVRYLQDTADQVHRHMPMPAARKALYGVIGLLASAKVKELWRKFAAYVLLTPA